jgi:glycosyltransferase involved in cell wall biosynthesis
VLRTLKYSRYLVEYGWRVTVISPRIDAYGDVDSRLEHQIPPATRVVRTRWLNSKRHFAIFGVYPSLAALPDSWIGWLPWGVVAGRRILRDDRPDLIYSTSPHATAHLIALILARRSGLPWVTDFRDPWFEELPERGAPAGPIYRRINRLLERRVVERCDHVVTTTTHLRDLLRTRYPELPREKITAIPNGYDEADFAGFSEFPRVRGDRFAMVHAGSINADFRDPRPLFRALRRLIDGGRLDRNSLSLRFIGPGDYADSEAVRSAVSEANLINQVEFLPRVPFDEALRELASADVLLLLQASADTVELIPAKLYEYLRAQKPVLAVVYPGATSEILSTTGGGWTVDPRDEAALEETIAVAYNVWVTGNLSTVTANLDTLRRYERRTLTGNLASLFDRLHACGVRAG